VVGAAPGVSHKEEVLFADENLFTFFSFRLRSGNPRTVLAGPRSVVLTEPWPASTSATRTPWARR
jgi:hypothetical protein